MSIRLKDTIYDLINKSTRDGSGNTIISTYLNKTTSGTMTGNADTVDSRHFSTVSTLPSLPNALLFRNYFILVQS